MMNEINGKDGIRDRYCTVEKRLPEGIGGQLESLLGDTSAKGSKSAGDQLGGLVGKLGGMLGKK